MQVPEIHTGSSSPSSPRSATRTRTSSYICRREGRAATRQGFNGILFTGFVPQLGKHSVLRRPPQPPNFHLLPPPATSYSLPPSLSHTPSIRPSLLLALTLTLSRVPARLLLATASSPAPGPPPPIQPSRRRSSLFCVFEFRGCHFALPETGAACRLRAASPRPPSSSRLPNSSRGLRRSPAEPSNLPSPHRKLARRGINGVASARRKFFPGNRGLRQRSVGLRSGSQQPLNWRTSEKLRPRIDRKSVV